MSDKSEDTKPIQTIPTHIPKICKRRTRKVDMEYLEKRAKTVLDREINHLLDLSYNGKLDKEAASSLVNYLKAIKDLKKEEEESLNNLSDEQLAKIAEGKDES